MLNLCGDLLVRFGGHEQAAGLTVERARIPEFRKRLNEVILENCDEGCFLPVAEYDSEMSLAEVTLETVEALETLEPTGCGNPAPAFLCRGAEVRESRRVGADRSHLKLTLSQGGAERGGIGFGLGDLEEPSPWRADVLFRPTRNEFGGRVSAQVQAQALRKAGPEGEENPEPSSGIFFTRCLQEMTGLAAKQREQAAGNVALRPEYLLKERLDASWAEKEQLGGFYRRMRAFAGGSLADLAAEAGVSQEQALFSLTVYEQLGLIRWSREPFSVAEVRQTGKRDLADSPLVRYVRGMEKTP